MSQHKTRLILAALACTASLAAISAPASATEFVTYTWTTTSQGYGLNLGQPTTASFDVALSAVQSGVIGYSDITNIHLTYPGLTFNSAVVSSGGLDNAAYVDPVTGMPIYHDENQGLAVIAFAGSDINSASTFLSITFDALKLVNYAPVHAVGDTFNALNNYNPAAGYPTAGYWTATFPVTSGVPEAATWAMMIAGFAMAGAAMRRRRTTVAFA